MNNNIPVQPKKSVRVIIELNWDEDRLDNILLEKIRNQEDNAALKSISRGRLKKLFAEGKVQIKGQNARPSSALAKGITYVDILDFVSE